MAAGRERATLVSFGVFTIIMGSSALSVRFSNRELAPLWGATLRIAAAAAVLLAIMALLRLKLPRGAGLTGVLLYGVCCYSVSAALYYYALVRLHAGLGQTLMALVPLITLLLAVLQRQECIRTGALVGVLLALAGVASLSRAPLQNGVPVFSLIAIVGSAAFFAQGLVLVRHFPPVHPVTLNALAMTIGATLLFVGVLFTHEPMTLPRRAETWVAFGYVVILCTVVAQVIYIFVLKHWTASRASYAFVVIPIVAVLLSAWLDHEPLRLELLLGATLVLTGVYIGALRPASSREAAPPSPV